MPANNSPTPPTGSVEAPKCCGYRVTYDPAVPMGEVRIVNAQGDTVVTLDLIHGGYTIHRAAGMKGGN